MNPDMRRYVHSWVLLAVFVPMVVMSSLHIHDSDETGTTCVECVKHHCHGHVGQLMSSVHDCVLCQFLSLSFVVPVVAAIAVYNKVFIFSDAERQSSLLIGASGIPTLRAPPAE